MSTPKNHHFVSKCHIERFFNSEGKIFLYDKELNNYYNRSSARRIFSEEHSNSIHKNGITDYQSLEGDLKIFEDDFPKNAKLIEQAILSKKIDGECYKALLNITMLGIIGNMRNPFLKREYDDAVDDLFIRIEPKMNLQQKKALENTLLYKKHVKHSNPIKYSSLALRVMDKMDGLDFVIWHIHSNDVFILPDTTAIIIRGQVEKTYNPFISQILEVGIPLTDKIFIHSISKKVNQNKSVILEVKENNNLIVNDINTSLLQFAVKTVATSNQEYLQNLVSLSR